MDQEKRSEMDYSDALSRMIILVVALFVFILVVTAVYGLQGRKKGESIFDDSMRAADQGIDSGLKEELYPVRSALRTASYLVGDRGLDVSAGDYSDIFEGLKSLGTDRIYISDSSGNRLSSQGTAGSLGPFAWNQQVLSGQEVLDASTDPDNPTGPMVFIIACPVKEGDKVTGAVSAVLNMDVFNGASGKYRMNWSAGNVLVAKDGTVLGQNGMNVFTPGRKLFGIRSFSVENEAEREAFLSGMEKGKAGTLSCTLNGKEHYLRYTPVVESRWYVLSFMEQKRKDEQVSSLTSAVKRIGIAFATAFLVFILMAIYIFFKEIRSDIRFKSKLRLDAETDLLTGVLNKLSAEKYIDEYMKDEGKSGFFYIIDLDNFKSINDNYGHAFGDEVLRAVGKRLITEFRATDIIGRLGGDEFCVFLKDLTSEEEKNKQIERMRGVFKNFQAGELIKFNPTASIGGAEFPKHGKTFQEIYKAADRALYDVKKSGKNGLKVYSKEGL